MPSSIIGKPYGTASGSALHHHGRARGYRTGNYGKGMACTAGRRLATVLFTGIGASIQAHSIACPLIPITAPHEATAQFQHGLPVLELPGFPEHVTPGTALASTAPFVIEAITQAVALAQQGLVRGIVTNPIQKSALYAAGFQDPGHTEFLARLAGKPPHIP